MKSHYDCTVLNHDIYHYSQMTYFLFTGDSTVLLVVGICHSQKLFTCIFGSDLSSKICQDFQVLTKDDCKTTSFVLNFLIILQPYPRSQASTQKMMMRLWNFSSKLLVSLTSLMNLEKLCVQVWYRTVDWMIFQEKSFVMLGLSCSCVFAGT